MVVAVRSGETFAAEAPHALFDSPLTPRWGSTSRATVAPLYIAGYAVFGSDFETILRAQFAQYAAQEASAPWPVGQASVPVLGLATLPLVERLPRDSKPPAHPRDIPVSGRFLQYP